MSKYTSVFLRYLVPVMLFFAVFVATVWVIRKTLKLPVMPEIQAEGNTLPTPSYQHQVYFFVIRVTGSDGKPCKITMKQDSDWASGFMESTTCPVYMFVPKEMER